MTRFSFFSSMPVLLLAACSSSGGGEDTVSAEALYMEPPTDLDGGDETAGRELFNTSCIACHGVDAVGTEGAPVLRGSLLDAETIATRIRTSGATDSEVYDGLTGGRTLFWAADRLTDDELRDLVAFVLSNEGGGGGNGQMGELRECDATHPKIGQETMLSTFAHWVSGAAVIVDDCTVRVDDFVYDGTGVDVRFYRASAANIRPGS